MSCHWGWSSPLRRGRAVATDYELVRWRASAGGPAPQVAGITAAINDAPIDDLDIEDEVFTADRIRDYETPRQSGHRLWRIIARHRRTGEAAGHTAVVVHTERPELAHQHDTAVVRDHRGHRLGLLLKAEMMRWLAEVEPQVNSIDTWNAETNDHMIAVNERLGYRPSAGTWRSRRAEYSGGELTPPVDGLLAATSSDVGDCSSSSSLRRESSTNGPANWYDVSASSRASPENSPEAFSTHAGSAHIRGAGTPAAAASAWTISRCVTAGAVGACSTRFHSSGVRAALIIARARSGTR